MTTNYHHHQQYHCHLTSETAPPPPTTTICHCHLTQPPPTTTTTTCHCHLTQPPPQPATTTTCTLCYTTTLHYPPSQNHHHAPPQNHHTHRENYHFAPTHQTHKKRQLFKKEPIQEPNPTVTSLIHRITALETTLRRRNHHHQTPQPSDLRHTAATTIQTHFRSFLIQRSKTLRHLKELAFIKSSLNNLKSFISNKTHFDSNLISRESINLLIKLDSIQGNDPMIRDGKRSISREMIRFMEFIDDISNKNMILKREVMLRGSGSRGYGDELRKLCENLEKRVNKVNAVGKGRRGGVLMKSVGREKSVRFDEDGNVYRLIERKRGSVLSDASDGSNGDEEGVVEEIGVSLKETEVEEEEEMSENEMDPRKNLGTRIHQTSKMSQRDQEDDEEEEEEDGDSFVFSAPLPAKMEYRVASKKQAAKH